MTCKLCQGKKFIEVSPTKVRVCECAYAAALRSHLGAEIATADTLTSSPLLDPTTGVDLTRENVFLSGPWEVVRSHLKWALAYKGLNFHFKILTDEKLKNVYVGSESYLSRSRKVRDDVDSYNSLSDLIGDYDLILIRLGFLGYSNRAAPGILKEAILLREGMRKPTWVMEEAPFQNCYSYSPEVANYLAKRYRHIKVDYDLQPERPLPRVKSNPEEDVIEEIPEEAEPQEFDDSPFTAKAKKKSTKRRPHA